MFRSFALALLFAAGCHAARSPELRVIGTQGQEARTNEVVYVQVTNPASRPMRLTRLEYRFASSTNTTLSEGDLALNEREVPPQSAVVVAVLCDAAVDETMTLRGKLTAEQDNIIKSFK